MLEGELQQAAAALPRVDAGGHGHGVRVVVDLNVVLVADVQALEVLAHHDQVDLVEAAARHEGARRTQVGVQLELLAQAHVGGAVAAARGGLERPLERQTRAPNAVDGLRRQRIARGLDACQPRRLPVPLEGRAERIERSQRGVDDLGADAVAGNQRGGNAF